MRIVISVISQLSDQVLTDSMVAAIRPVDFGLSHWQLYDKPKLSL